MFCFATESHIIGHNSQFGEGVKGIVDLVVAGGFSTNITSLSTFTSHHRFFMFTIFYSHLIN